MSLNGLVVDPVCGMEFDEVNAAASVEWRGQTHWFCTDACKDDFERHTETNALGKKFDPKSKMTVTGITPEEAEAVAMFVWKASLEEQKKAAATTATTPP